MFLINPSKYQFYDSAVVVDGYQENRQGNLNVEWTQSKIVTRFWNYNGLAPTSRILIIKTIDSSIYDTDKIVLKNGPLWTGAAAVMELEPIRMQHATTEAHKHCAVVAFVRGQALSQVRKEKEMNKLAIMDKLRNKILYFQHSQRY